MQYAKVYIINRSGYLNLIVAVLVDHFLDREVAGVVDLTAVLLQGAASVGSIEVLLNQSLELIGEAQDLSVLQVAEEIDHAGGGRTELGGVLVDLADQSLLAVEVGGVEFSPGFLSDADPVDDVEFLPVNGVGVERSGEFSTIVTPGVTVIAVATVCVFMDRGSQEVIEGKPTGYTP